MCQRYYLAPHSVRKSGRFYDCFNEEVKRHKYTWSKSKVEMNSRGSKAVFFFHQLRRGSQLDLFQLGWNLHGYQLSAALRVVR